MPLEILSKYNLKKIVLAAKIGEGDTILTKIKVANYISQVKMKFSE